MFESIANRSRIHPSNASFCCPCPSAVPFFHRFCIKSQCTSSWLSPFLHPAFSSLVSCFCIVSGIPLSLRLLACWFTIMVLISLVGPFPRALLQCGGTDPHVLTPSPFSYPPQLASTFLYSLLLPIALTAPSPIPFRLSSARRYKLALPDSPSYSRCVFVRFP